MGVLERSRGSTRLGGWSWIVRRYPSAQVLGCKAVLLSLLKERLLTQETGPNRCIYRCPSSRTRGSRTPGPSRPGPEGPGLRVHRVHVPDLLPSGSFLIGWLHAKVDALPGPMTVLASHLPVGHFSDRDRNLRTQKSNLIHYNHCTFCQKHCTARSWLQR